MLFQPKYKEHLILIFKWVKKHDKSIICVAFLNSWLYIWWFGVERNQMSSSSLLAFFFFSFPCFSISPTFSPFIYFQILLMGWISWHLSVEWCPLSCYALLFSLSFAYPKRSQEWTLNYKYNLGSYTIMFTFFLTPIHMIYWTLEDSKYSEYHYFFHFFW